MGHKPVKFEWGSIDPDEILKKYEKKSTPKTYHNTVSYLQKLWIHFMNESNSFTRIIVHKI